MLVASGCRTGTLRHPRCQGSSTTAGGLPGKVQAALLALAPLRLVAALRTVDDSRSGPVRIRGPVGP